MAVAVAVAVKFYLLDTLIVFFIEVEIWKVSHVIFDNFKSKVRVRLVLLTLLPGVYRFWSALNCL